MTIRTCNWTNPAVLAIAIACLSTIIVPQAAQAQTFTVLHTFDHNDGQSPVAATLDSTGDLWGTAYLGGPYDDGTVWELSQGSWNFSVRYVFGANQNDGVTPNGPIVQGPNGVLYGTAGAGGTCGAGTVFQLTPPVTASRTAANSHWTLKVIHNFCGGSDGTAPGGLTVDGAGNLYGKTGGGAAGWGTVFKLTHSSDGWTYSLLYAFTGGADGAAPLGGVTLDAAGNLYGTTEYGGVGPGYFGFGVVYKLTPSGSESVLYTFPQSGPPGGHPVAGVVLDRSGNVYGTTVSLNSENSPVRSRSRSVFAPPGFAVVFELSPSGDGWNFTVIHPFDGYFAQGYDLNIDASGNLYGTVRNEGPDYDEAYELTPSDQGWIYTVLHDFTGGDDGYSPWGIVPDGSGNIFGVCFNGGSTGYGVVWEITP